MEDIEFEVDISELFRHLLKKVKTILVYTVIFALLGWVAGVFLMTPKYTASTRVYVLNRSNDASIVYADIQISTYVSHDFEVLITGPNVTREVRSRLGLDMTDAQLSGMITVTPMEETRVLQIDVTHSDPQTAANIANCVREVSAEQIQSFVDADAVKTVYEADVPRKPSSMSAGRVAFIAALLGLFLSAGVYTTIFILDDTIRTEEDVERYLGLSVLGAIPESEDLKNQKSSPKKPRSRK